MKAIDFLNAVPTESAEDFLGSVRDEAASARAKKSPSTMDYVRALASGVNNIITTTGEGLNLIGADRVGKTVREFGQSGEQYWQEAMTPAGQEAASGDLANSPLSTIGMAAAQSVPGMAAMFVPGLGVTKALKAANVARPVFGALKDVGVGARRAARIARAVPVAIGMGASEGVYSGLSNAAQTAQEIAQVPIEKLAQTQAYQALASSNPNLSPEDIRELMSREAEYGVALKTAPWTGTVGALTGGGILGQMAQKATGGIAKNVVKGAAKEAWQEIPQSGGEQYIQNVVAADTYDPARSAWQDVAKQAIIGGGAGGLLGGLGGGVHAAVKPDIKPDAKPDMTARDEMLNKAAEDVRRTEQATRKLQEPRRDIQDTDTETGQAAPGQEIAPETRQAVAEGFAALPDLELREFSESEQRDKLYRLAEQQVAQRKREQEDEIIATQRAIERAAGRGEEISTATARALAEAQGKRTEREQREADEIAARAAAEKAEREAAVRQQWLAKKAEREQARLARQPALSTPAAGIANVTPDIVNPSVAGPAELQPSVISEQVTSVQVPAAFTGSEQPVAVNAEQPATQRDLVREGLTNLVGQAVKREAMESRGHAVLDDIEEAGISPQNIAKQFWSQTFFNMPAAVQRRFEKLLKAHTGMEPGSATSSDRITGAVTYAKDWQDVADQIDLPNTADALEGTDRGFVVLMHEANQRFTQQPADQPVQLAPPVTPPVAPVAPQGETIAQAGGASTVKIGDPVRIMNVDSIVARTQTIDGVRYDLFNGAELAEQRAAVRVVDEDSGNVVSVKQYPNFDAAEKAYNTAVSDAAKAETPAQPVVKDRGETTITPEQSPRRIESQGGPVVPSRTAPVTRAGNEIAEPAVARETPVVPKTGTIMPKSGTVTVQFPGSDAIYTKQDGEWRQQTRGPKGRLVTNKATIASLEEVAAKQSVTPATSDRPSGEILGKDVREIADKPLAGFAKSKTARIADLAKAELAWRANKPAPATTVAEKATDVVVSKPDEYAKFAPWVREKLEAAEKSGKVMILAYGVSKNYALYQDGARAGFDDPAGLYKDAVAETSGKADVLAMRNGEDSIIAMTKAASARIAAYKEKAEAKRVADEQRQAEEAAAIEKSAREHEAYFKAIAEVQLPKGTKKTITGKNPKTGEKFEIAGTDYDGLLIHKQGERTKYNEEPYAVSDSKSGLRIAKFRSLDQAKDLIRAIIHAKLPGRDNLAKLSKAELNLWKEVVLAHMQGGSAPAYFTATPPSPAAPVAAETNPDQPRAVPVAESQAPATSEPGDAGVAPGQDSAGPDTGAQYSLGDIMSAQEFQPNEANREITDRLQAALKAEGQNFTITPVALPNTVGGTESERKAGSGPENQFQLAERISGIFGKQIIWMTADGPFAINGVVHTGELAPYVFIDVRSREPAHVILGHELAHHIQRDTPQIYKTLVNALSGVLRNHEEYRAKAGLEELSREEVTDEMIGDLLGDNFDRREFWNRVAKQSQGTFRSIAETIKRWLDKIIKLITGAEGVERFVTDIHAARRALAQAVIDYAESRQEQVSPEWRQTAGTLQYSQQNLADRIDAVLRGNSSRIPIYLGETPAVLRRLGLEPLPMGLDEEVADKAMFDHGMSSREMKALADAVADPVAVVDSEAKNAPEGALVVITDLVKSDGRPIIVAVHPDYYLSRTPVNMVASVYPKDNAKRSVGRWLATRLRYVNNEKRPEWQRLSGVQFPGKMPTRGVGKIVLSEKEFVKSDFIATWGENPFPAAANAPFVSGPDDDIRYSRAIAVQQSPGVFQGVMNVLKNSAKSPDELGPINFVNTPMHKAEMLARKGIPGYKRVFERLQAYIHDSARFAVQAERLMPGIMRELRGIGFKDIREYFNAASDPKDIKAIGPWLNQGTLYGGGNPLEGVIWTNAEMRGRETKERPIPRNLKPLTDKQIELYHQVVGWAKTDPEKPANAGLGGIGQALEINGKALIYRHVNRYGISFDEDMSLADVAEIVREQIVERIASLQQRIDNAKEEAGERFSVSDALRTEIDEYVGDKKGLHDLRVRWQEAKKADEAASKNVERLQAEMDTLVALRGDTEEQAEVKIQAGEKPDPGTIRGIAQHAQALIDHGYMPLKRFGTKVLVAYDKDNKTKFFAAFDGTPLVPGSANRQLQAAMVELKAIHPEWRIQAETRSEWQPYKGLSLDALETFMDFLDPETKAGLERDKTVQEYLKNAVNNRSVLKELIHRKGTPGFSEDVPRVLAAFITSHARNAAGLYHLADARRLAEEIPDRYGTVKTEAGNLIKYVETPGEESAVLRSFLFFNYLGGSIAAAGIQLLQTVQTTAPYLSQFTGVGDLTTTLGNAAKLAVGDPAAMEGKLGEDLKRAELAGVTAPQMIYHLAAMAANNPFSSDRRFRTAMTIWNGMFGATEVFNRRVAFIAAHDMASRVGMDAINAELKRFADSRGEVARRFDNAYDFAADAVDQTQFIYSKTNRPNIAQGPIGATVMTFRQFSISYLELLRRLPPKQQLVMLGVLVLMSGVGGLPFAEDLEDLVNTLGQWLGFSTNAGKWTGKHIRDFAGKDAERAILKGLGGMLPLDLHSRVGMHNLLPATAVAMPAEIEKLRDVYEALGPAGGVLRNVMDGLALLARGKWDKAALQVAPKAARDFYNGVYMGVTGTSEDTRGRMGMKDVTLGEAMNRAIGFNPQRAAREGEIRREEQLGKNLRLVRLDDIASDWADGILRQDSAKQAEARARLREWNTDNPELRITGEQIMRSVRERVNSSRLTSQERFLKSLPKTMRPEAREAFR